MRCRKENRLGCVNEEAFIASCCYLQKRILSLAYVAPGLFEFQPSLVNIYIVTSGILDLALELKLGIGEPTSGGRAILLTPSGGRRVALRRGFCDLDS